MVPFALPVRLTAACLAALTAPAALGLVATLVAVPPALAGKATVYAGSWGPAEAGQGRVFRHESDTTWTEISPPGGLADAVWDLEWLAGELWAATQVGPESTFDADTPHGWNGRVYKWDGANWADMSPAAGFGSAVTTISQIDDIAYITVDHLGLLRHEGGTTWTQLGDFRLAAQAHVSDAHDGRPVLYMGQDNTDEFWVHDPGGVMPCGDPAPHPVTGLPRCQIPGGSTCSADCYSGSCIHALATFDDGAGPRVYGGAWRGQMYRWNPGTRLFERIDPAPVEPMIDEHVQGLAPYHGRLWLGTSQGLVWSSADATGSSWVPQTSFTPAFPVSEMMPIPEDDELWFGLGSVPYRWAQRAGSSDVQMFDGLTYHDRAIDGTMGAGILALLAVVPVIDCDAGAAQLHECAGPTTEVTLDGSASTWSQGFDATVTWSGPFEEGTASGLSPVVHFAGTGEFTCTLTIAVRGLTVSCDTQVTIRDTTPPELVARGGCLWPPNHRYRCFGVADLLGGGSATTIDACEGATAVRITGVASSQPEDVNGQGDGHTQDDALFDESMTCLRGERLGGDEAGRSYAVTLESTDSAGNTARVTTTVSVPHDQSRDERCEGRPPDVGLLPHAPLPLGPDVREGTYAELPTIR